MTVAAWIESLKKFDPALDVVVRMENFDSGDEMMATQPVFAMDIGCGADEYLGIRLMDEDEGVEEIEAAIDDLPDLPSADSGVSDPQSNPKKARKRDGGVKDFLGCAGVSGR